MKIAITKMANNKKTTPDRDAVLYRSKSLVFNYLSYDLFASTGKF
jgi:hypothetical protein